jgi:hypothetical protein
MYDYCKRYTDEETQIISLIGGYKTPHKQTYD